MADDDIHLVVGRGAIADDRPVVRVTGPSTGELLAQVEAAPESARIVAAIDAAVADRDELVALVSVLVVKGVQVFETSQPHPVRRILDAHLAIDASEIEVLEA